MIPFFLGPAWDSQSQKGQLGSRSTCHLPSVIFRPSLLHCPSLTAQACAELSWTWLPLPPQEPSVHVVSSTGLRSDPFPIPLSSEVISSESLKRLLHILNQTPERDEGSIRSSSQVRFTAASPPPPPGSSLIGNLGRNSTGDHTEASGILLPPPAPSSALSWWASHSRPAQATFQKAARPVGRLAYTPWVGWGGRSSVLVTSSL